MANSLERMLDSVADPTDFPPDPIAPGLRSLDRAFRCSICSDIYQAPMNLPCGHCFCSYCIRQSLQREEHCPACRKTASGSGLRKDTSMEEAVIAWNMAREFVLRLSRAEEDAQVKAEVLKKNDGKKRKRSIELSSTDAGPSKIQCNGIKERRKEEEEEEVEMGVDGVQVPSSDAEEETEDIIECPMCHNKVLLTKINQHMDKGCRLSPSDTATSIASKAKKKQAWAFLGGGSCTSSNGQKGKNKVKPETAVKEVEVEEEDEEEEEPNRIATVTYNVQSDKKLRQMLKDLNLPTHGDRTALIGRHTQFILLHNSNLDKTRRLRKSHNELVKELRIWEQSRNTKKLVIEDGDAYVRANKDAFAYHIAQVRNNRPKGSKDSSSAPSKGSDSGGKITGQSASVGNQKEDIEHDNGTIILDSEDDS